MSSSYASERPTGSDLAPAMSGWIGLAAFAGIMLLIIGSLHVAEGLLAFFREDYYADASRLPVDLSYPTWGWIHVVFGALLAATGIGIFFGALWARVLGIVYAALSALTCLTFLAALPLWGTIMIALNILVIYALAAHGRDVRPRSARGANP